MGSQIVRKKQMRSQVFNRVVMLFFVLLMIGVLFACSIGISYARYMTVGEASVQFVLSSKPCLTVTATAQDFSVLSVGEMTDARFRIRLYGNNDAPKSCTISFQDKKYTLAVQELSSNTMEEADWVGTFVDAKGQEILFEATDKEMIFVGDGEIIFSGLHIVAEAIKR